MNSLTLLSSLSLITFFLTFTSTTAQTTTFKCSSTTSCQALIDYVPINATTFSNIKTLFGVKNLRSLFGANSLPLSTSPNQTVAAKQKIKIPFPCVCNNGTGISNKRPVYTVKAGDGLDFIARTIFSNLMTYQQIAAVNNISDPNLIIVGQKLVIPLPCSCDDVDGMKVVHYGYVVPMGSSIQQIADEYDTTAATLLRLNDLADAGDLKADSVLDVPLRVCTSMISNSSMDYPLLVPNGTYTFTANNCVQCNCEKSNNWTLQCEPAPSDVKKTNWPQCPSMQCEGTGGLTLGNETATTSCGRSTCAYTGYTNQTILTQLVSDPSCTNGTDGTPNNNDAKNISPRWWSWIWLLVSMEVGLLGFGLL